MRFAYIDSQGNEVAIPSVDALALRVELGAIGPDTDLYDAQADRWGPASSHEIFHTLSRETGPEGYVAPPPPPPESARDASAGEEVEEGGAGDTPGQFEAVLPSFDLTADFGGDQEEGLAPMADPGTESPEEDVGIEELDFGIGLDALEPEGERDEAEEPVAGPSSGGEPFDFGSMDALDLDEAADGGLAQPGDGDMLDGGMILEEPLSDRSDFGEASQGPGDLELEQPLSSYSESAPPAWMEQDGPAGFDEDDGAMDFATPETEGEDREDAEEPKAPAPQGPAGPSPRPSPVRSRPSPPRRERRRSMTAPLLGVLAVGVLAVGGWLAWQALQTGGGEAETVQRPPVTLPEIPAELLPVMREVGEEALAGTVAELEAMADASGLAEEPRQDWLSGVYLANAGQFSDVRSYWAGIAGFVDGAREADARLFHQRYEESLAARSVAADTGALLLARADSGFLATEAQRAEAYAQMQALVDAALELHTFLVANEGEIGYEPAAGGMSADPVLEAVPATPELGDEMWNRVDRITGALDRLGTLDRVTTDRLLTVLFDRIRQAGFR